MLVYGGRAAEQLRGDFGLTLASEQVLQDLALARSEAEAAHVHFCAVACTDKGQEFIVREVEEGAGAGTERRHVGQA
jgi:hypothetical protein